MPHQKRRRIEELAVHFIFKKAIIDEIDYLEKEKL
jgi:hypothetical protein